MAEAEHNKLDETVPTDGANLRDCPENELLRLAKTGDDEAYGEIVRRHQARMRAFASRYVENSHDVFDLVQDAFLDGYRHLDRFDLSRDFGPWLRAICRNRILNYFRARKTKENVTTQLVDEALAERISADSHGDDAEGNLARIEALKSCLAKLTTSQLKFIRLRYHSGLTIKAIADETGLTPDSLAMRLVRIRGQLKKCMMKQLS